MEIKIHAIDGYKNISENALYMLSDAIDSFANVGISLAQKNGISLGQAFHRYVSPLRSCSEYAHRYQFDVNKILTPQLTNSGREQSPAISTYSRSIGLISEHNGCFEISPIGRLLLLREISVEEYAFILLSKQGVFADQIYKGKLLTYLAKYFQSNRIITETDFTNYIENCLTDKTPVSYQGRTDILFNALQIAGLITLIDKGKYICTKNCDVILRDFLDFEDVLSVTPYPNNEYYSYAGLESTGVFEILNNETADHYQSNYPNLYRYNSRKKSTIQRDVASITGENLQQIYYGAPGTGKSHELNKKTKGHEVIRTTFHPDSDYSTFVGAYKPVSEEVDVTTIVGTKMVPVVDVDGNPAKEKKINYRFVEQAFLQAYIKAWEKLQNTPATKDAPVSTNAKIRLQKCSAVTGSNTTFVYEPRNRSLSQDQIDALLAVDNYPYSLAQNGNLGDLHAKVDKVIVTDRPRPDQVIRRTINLDEVNREIKAIREQNEQRVPGIDPQRLYIKLQELLNIQRQCEEHQLDPSNPLVTFTMEPMGLYVDSENSIYLFLDVIESISKDEDLLASVYVHELFHSYFKTGAKYIPEIEEPIVELATITFFKDYKPGFDYYSKVKDKQSGCFCYYGFGATLYDQKLIDWEDQYYQNYKHIDATNRLVKQYVERFSPCFPFSNEDLALVMLKRILTTTSSSAGTIVRDNAVILVIEEINRGNCAQIFGDLFQLLDRNKHGYSEYPIDADSDLKRHLYEKLHHLTIPNEQSINAAYEGKDVVKEVLNGDILLLPENLYIWATMNTSDQSLFPMDSAFKRRWEWIYQPVVEAKDDAGATLGWKIKVDDQHEPVDWWKFLERINKTIADLTSAEDKQLGYFFCKPDLDEKTISAKRFVGKVIFYLWNDVFKDYAFDVNCCKCNTETDEKDKPTMYAKFYDQDGKEPNIEALVRFFQNLEANNGELIKAVE